VTGVADETAYYFNSKLEVLALIKEGVRFPAGIWSRIINGSAQRSDVERLLTGVFPSLRGKAVTFVALSTDADVKDFEKAQQRRP